MGDFTGFEFGGVHSSELGIIRVSDGDRYDEKLHPEVEDITAEIPGLDGNYYFGTNYKPKSIEVKIAFDSLNEEQFRKLKRVFDLKKTKELIFDENPYKKYIAKVENPIELSFVCFDMPKRVVDTARDGVRRDRDNDTVEEETFSDTITISAETTVEYQLQHTPNGEVTIEGTEDYSVDNDVYTFINDTEEDIDVTISYVYEVNIYRWEQVTPYRVLEETECIYKGDGTISFICYFPFAKSVFKSISAEYEDSDWAAASGILTESEYEDIDEYDSETGIINIYNGGDIETGFRLAVLGALASNSVLTLSYKKDDLEVEATASLAINSFTLETGDIGFLIDTNNCLIVGIKEFIIDAGGNASYKTSSNLYNKYIDSGYFFHLQPNGKYDNATLEISNGTNDVEIFYDYLYF